MDHVGIDKFEGLELLLKRAPHGIGNFLHMASQAWAPVVTGLTPRADDPGGMPYDARILPVSFDASGQRDFELREYTRSHINAIFEDWPLQGPRSLHWVLKFVQAQAGGSLTSRVQQFMAITKLGYNDGSMAEYGLIAKKIDIAIAYGGINICNCSAFELLARRFQLIEEKFRHRLPAATGNNPTDPDADSSLYLGLGLHRSYDKQAVCVMPQLSEFVGDELGKEAAITKGKVKAHQLREEMRKLAKGAGKNKKQHETEE